MINVKFKRVHSLTPKPTKATSGSAAVDLVAVDAEINYAKGYIEYRTGLHVAIPEGYGGYLYPRSSISKTPHSLANSVGLVDSDYRGEICIRMRFNEYNCVDGEDVYKIGDRIAQMVIQEIPEVKYDEVDTIDELGGTSRGSGGFGSTGK